MRKPLLLFVLLALSFSAKPIFSQAQITGVTLSVYDAILPNTCLLPAKDSVLVFGYTSGTSTTADTVTLNLNFDDGFDTIVKIGLSAGTSVSFYSNVIHTITMPGTYSTYVTAIATGGSTASATSPAAYVLSDSCSTTQGMMYFDLNGNCVRDPGEPGMMYMPILIVNTVSGDTTFAGWTDDTGHYSITLLPGSYELLTNNEPVEGNIVPTCPSSGATSFSVFTSGTYTYNFAYQCGTPTSFDMRASLAYTSLVAGHDADMWIDCSDWFWFSRFNCTSLTSTVTLTMDPRISYVSFISAWGPGPSSVSGSTLTWNLSTLDDMYGLWAEIHVHCSSTLTIGDTLCNTLYASPTSLTDPDLANNTVHACTPAGAAYDPNGKAVSPLGIGSAGYIPNNTPLSYVIHFQNTGTAAAESITVVDTLNSNLDMKTLHVVNASAPVNIYSSGNIVKFRFNNINLPDSSVSPNGSIGAIEFDVMPKSGLAPGTLIPNRAGIYFDYNPVVMTNTTLNTIELTTGAAQLATKAMNVSVYPNPADDHIVVITNDHSDFTVSMIDLLGRTIETGSSANGTAKINTKSVTEGLYLLKVNDLKGNDLTTKVEVSH